MSRNIDLQGLPDDVAGILIIGATDIDEHRQTWTVKWQPINLWRPKPMDPKDLLQAVQGWVAQEELRQALDADDITPEDFGGPSSL